jgi:uncharacterized DUF497 family protein
MEFEWDDAKSERNRRERGFDFATAALIFEGRSRARSMTGAITARSV